MEEQLGLYPEKVLLHEIFVTHKNTELLLEWGATSIWTNNPKHKNKLKNHPASSRKFEV